MDRMSLRGRNITLDLGCDYRRQKTSNVCSPKLIPRITPRSSTIMPERLQTTRNTKKSFKMSKPDLRRPLGPQFKLVSPTSIQASQ